MNYLIDDKYLFTGDSLWLGADGGYGFINVLADNVKEIMPILCEQDQKIAEAMQGRLVRCHTVANGDDYCDWWYFGNKIPVTEEEKEYIAKQKGGPL